MAQDGESLFPNYLLKYFSNKMFFAGEINDAKMSSFSSDFQTLI